MTRRRWRLLVLALILALFASFIARLPVLTGHLVARSLSSFFHRPASVGRVRFHLFPFGAEILDLRIGGLTPQASPFLEVPRVTLAPSLGSLWDRRVVLTRLRLQGPRIRIHAFPEGGDDIPKMGGGKGGGGEVRIRRLTIEGGEFVLDHDRVPLDLDLPEFQGKLGQRRAGVLAGTVSFGPGPLCFGSAPPLSVSTEIDLRLEGSLLTVESGHLRTSSTDLAYTGQIRIAARPKGEFHLVGPVDLDELDRHVMRTGFGIRGAARWEGTLGVDGSRLRIRGRMEGSAGVFDGVPVPRYAGEVAWDSDGVHLRQLEVSTLGGSGTLDIEIPPGKSIARLDGRLRDVDAEGAVTAIFDIGAFGLGSAATGTIAIEWPRGHFRELSGRIALDLATRPDGRTPLSGRFEWRAESGVQFIEKANLHTPSTQARLAGRIEIDDHTDMSVDGESNDLAATDDVVLRLRRALGAPEAHLAGFSGSGLFRGRWKGTLQSPVFEGRFTGQGVGYLGVIWGRVEWAGLADPFEVRSHSLVLRRPGGELWLDGRAEIGLYGEHDAVDVRVRFENWPAADFIRAFEWRIDVSGLLSGEATVGGRRSSPIGNARVTAREGLYYAIPYANLDLQARLRGPLTEVTSGRVYVGSGAVDFRGSLTDDGFYDGSAEARDVDVGDVLPPLAPGARWGGKVTGGMTLQGTLDRPRLSGRVSSSRIFVGDEGVGALDARFKGSGDGSVVVEARCRSTRVDLTLTGTVGADIPYDSSLRIAARETSLDPFLRSIYPVLPTVAGIVGTGELELRGPLNSPLGLLMEGTVSDLQVLLPEYPVRNRGPVRLILERGRLVVRDFRMAGEGTDLVVAGSADTLGGGPLDLTVRGEADLRTLSVVTRQLRGRGAARLAMTVGGTRASPRVEGSLELDGAGLRVRGFPHGIDGVRGTVRYTESAAHFEGVAGTLGGGAVELEGQASYSQGRLSSFDFRSVGRGLGLRYPEGLRSVIDTDIRCSGDAARQWVTGRVDVRQALWTRRYDVASELLAATGPGLEESGSLGEGVRYDLKIRAPGTLKIDNNLTTLQARAELTLTGGYDAPVILGRAEIDRGRVYFQGNTYVIRRGTLDFADPRKIDPLFDIEAETRIRAYRVTLKVNGTLERVYPTLTSDPPLTAVQILNLLAGADESTLASLGQGATEHAQANLAATGAATLAAGKISEQVGLERGAERLFGLNRFSIDPSIVRGNVTNPTARLTVGKRLTPDLSVLYSVDLRGTEERLLSVEYTVSDRFSLLLTRTEPGGFGFDLRRRLTR